MGAVGVGDRRGPGLVVAEQRALDRRLAGAAQAERLEARGALARERRGVVGPGLVVLGRRGRGLLAHAVLGEALPDRRLVRTAEAGLVGREVGVAGVEHARRALLQQEGVEDHLDPAAAARALRDRGRRARRRAVGPPPGVEHAKARTTTAEPGFGERARREAAPPARWRACGNAAAGGGSLRRDLAARAAALVRDAPAGGGRDGGGDSGSCSAMRRFRRRRNTRTWTRRGSERCIASRSHPKALSRKRGISFPQRPPRKNGVPRPSACRVRHGGHGGHGPDWPGDC